MRGLRQGRAVSPEQLAEVAQHLREGGEQARALARGLDPTEIAGEGLPGALGRLAVDTASWTGVACTFEAGPDLPALPPPVASQLYWIAQEAVTNALKHAAAKRIGIALRLIPADAGDPSPPAFVLTVADDGDGLPGGYEEEAPVAASHDGGMGLRTMGYRASYIGATLTFTSGTGEGVTVSCRVPLPAPAEPPA